VEFFDELKQLIVALEANQIDYALCGGVALAIHGAPRATQGIDILLRPEDLGRLRDVARSRGFTLEALPMDFASGVTIQRFTKPLAEPLMLDVLFASGPATSAWDSRLVAEFEGGVVRVVSREGLVSLKLAAGRPQDIADIKRLEEVQRG
jgi:hypothetical protein